MMACMIGLPAISYTAASWAATAEGIPPSVSRWVAFSWAAMVRLAEVHSPIWARVTLAEGPSSSSRVWSVAVWLRGSLNVMARWLVSIW